MRWAWGVAFCLAMMASPGADAEGLPPVDATDCSIDPEPILTGNLVSYEPCNWIVVDLPYEMLPDMREVGDLREPLRVDP